MKLPQRYHYPALDLELGILRTRMRNANADDPQTIGCLLAFGLELVGDALREFSLETRIWLTHAICEELVGTVNRAIVAAEPPLMAPTSDLIH